MRRRLLAQLIGVGLVLAIGASASALRWSPNELDIAQEPGSVESYQLLLKNEESEPAQVTIFVADWFRDEQGFNDLSLPLNGARWIFTRAFEAGETLTVRYEVTLPSRGEVGVIGAFRAWSPQVVDAVSGPSAVSSAMVGTPGLLTGGQVSVERRVEQMNDLGVATIELTIRTSIAFEGLSIEEVFAEGVSIESVDAAGARFDTVNRSCVDWVSVSHDELTLQPEESREVELTVRTPDDYSGMYWCIVHAESRATQVIGEIAGTQIISRPSVGLKVLVTAPGTEVLAGEVRAVSIAETDPLTLLASFENTGNVQLVVTAEAQIVSQTGAVIAQLPFAEYGRDYFRILPGSTRTIPISGFETGEALAAGIYQAIVSFDFGGDSLVVGVKGFRIR